MVPCNPYYRDASFPQHTVCRWCPSRSTNQVWFIFFKCMNPSNLSSYSLLRSILIFSFSATSEVFIKCHWALSNILLVFISVRYIFQNGITESKSSLFWTWIAIFKWLSQKGLEIYIPTKNGKSIKSSLNPFVSGCHCQLLCQSVWKWYGFGNLHCLFMITAQSEHLFYAFLAFWIFFL